MAGILDAKERVLDTIITETGRAQIATGQLNIQYASFSDRQMYYTTGSNGALDDPGARIYFESYSTDSDVIIQELDADADLAPFKTDSFTLYGGNVISGSDNQEQSNVRLYADALPEDSLKSLQRQMTLGTRDFLRNVKIDAFEITPSDMTFFIDQVNNEETPDDQMITSASLDDIESLWQDYRLQNLPNYQYLPPTAGDRNLGNYTKISQNGRSFATLEESWSGMQKQVLTFSNTRTSNDLLCQIFEISEKKLSKLTTIDGGSYMTSDSNVEKHVAYAGKLYRDTKGSLTFANIFTLVFE